MKSIKHFFSEYSGIGNITIVDYGKKNKPTKQELIPKMLGTFKRFFSKSNTTHETSEMSFNNNIEGIIKRIERAKKIDSEISRTLWDLQQKANSNGFIINGSDKDINENIVYLLELDILNAGGTFESFIRELINNCISYSNFFIYRGYDPKTMKSNFLEVIGSRGFEPFQLRGSEVLKWNYSYTNGSENKIYTNKNIVHISIFKETTDIFGTPLILPALQDVQIYRDLESSCIEDYLDSLNKKIIVYVGTPDKPGTPKEIEELEKKLFDITDNDELIINGKTKLDVFGKMFDKNGLILLENMKKRVSKGLGSASGESTGRQDADIKDLREDILVECIQTYVEEEINRKILLPKLIECYGVERAVKSRTRFKFNKTLTTKERIEKHVTYLFLSGIIDIDEARKMCNLNNIDFDIKKTYSNLFGGAEGTNQAEASNKTNPTNQHGNKGNSKPSTKN